MKPKWNLKKVPRATFRPALSFMFIYLVLAIRPALAQSSPPVKSPGFARLFAQGYDAAKPLAGRLNETAQAADAIRLELARQIDEFDNQLAKYSTLGRPLTFDEIAAFDQLEINLCFRAQATATNLLRFNATTSDDLASLEKIHIEFSKALNGSLGEKRARAANLLATGGYTAPQIQIQLTPEERRAVLEASASHFELVEVTKGITVTLDALEKIAAAVETDRRNLQEQLIPRLEANALALAALDRILGSYQMHLTEVATARNTGSVLAEAHKAAGRVVDSLEAGQGAVSKAWSEMTPNRVPAPLPDQRQPVIVE